MADPARDDSVATRDDTPLQEEARTDGSRASNAGSRPTHSPDHGMLPQCTRTSLETLQSIADARGWTEVSYDVRNELQLHFDETRRE